MGVKGNERAKEATEEESIRRCQEMFVSLVHVRRTISERKLREAKHWFRGEND